MRHRQYRVDAFPHVLATPHRVADDLIRVGIEYAGVAFLQDLHTTTDCAQRFLQIV